MLGKPFFPFLVEPPRSKYNYAKPRRLKLIDTGRVDEIAHVHKYRKKNRVVMVAVKVYTHAPIREKYRA